MKDGDPVFVEFKALTSGIVDRDGMLRKFGKPDSVFENSDLKRIQYTFSNLISGLEVFAFETIDTSELEFVFMEKQE